MGDPDGLPRQEVSVTYRAEYMWIDGTEPTAEIRSKTKIIPDGGEIGIWGFDGSSTNQATGDNSDVVLEPGLHLPGPDPGRRQRPGHVRDPADRRPLAPPDQHPGRGPGRAGQVRRPGAAVRPRAGVHDARPGLGLALRLPGARLPRPPGPVLLRRRRGEDRRPRHRRGAHHPVHRGGPGHLRHQRRGHARPVGVPDRPGRHRRRGRPPLDRPLPALPPGREVQRRDLDRGQADEG